LNRILALAAIALLPGVAAAAPRVAVDIAPLHSIVARVMAGIGAPELIVPPGVSEHDYALKPSQAAVLQDADLVVWTGPELTPWLAGPVAALASGATIAIEDVPGVRKLRVRTGGPFEGDAEPGHAWDGHLWLDPGNAAAAARAVAAALAAADPASAAGYAANAEGFAAEADTLAAEIEARLAPLRGRRYLVFHDAYQYFERRFDFPAAGSVALGDGAAPGAARVAAIRERVRATEVVCAFAEPQFEPKLLGTVTEGTGVRSGVLDPIGAGLTPGPGLYPALMRGLADSLAACLGG
jgi:zinc transport system substrate-binding protein